jgi:hypothetical protein
MIFSKAVASRLTQLFSRTVALVVVFTTLTIGALRSSAAEMDPSAKVASPALQAILQGIRDGESLFRNLHFEYTKEIKAELTGEKLAADKKRLGKSFLKEARLECRLIQQGRRFYFRDSEKSDGGGGLCQITKTIVSNGKRIRVVQTSNFDGKLGGHANLITGEEPSAPSALSPQKMGTHHGALLSDTLAAMTEVRLEGEENVRGIPCVRIVGHYRVKDDAGRLRQSRSVYWLAVDRHYLPVKYDFYAYEYSSNNRFVSAEASDWREIEPGIFSPFKSVFKAYWSEDLKRNQETVASSTTVTLRQVSLRPNFEETLFEELPIPDGLVVYVSENGKMLNSYVQGEEPVATRGRNRRLLWIYGIGALVFCAYAVWLALRKRTRRQSK